MKTFLKVLLEPHEIARFESQLGETYGKLWDSVNVYAKYIGTTTDKTKPIQFCFCVFQIDRMSRGIVKQEHVLV